MKKKFLCLIGVFAALTLIATACGAKDEKLAREAGEKNAQCPIDDGLGGVIKGITYDSSEHNLTLLYECGAPADLIESQKPDAAGAFAMLQALNQESPVQLLISMALMADASVTLAWEPANNGQPIGTTVPAEEVKTLGKAGYVSGDARGRLTLAALAMRANGALATEEGIGFNATEVKYEDGKIEYELKEAPEWDAKGQLWKEMKEAVAANSLTRQMLQLAADLGCSVEFDMPDPAEDVVFEASGLVLLFR